jgi:hypothetical protein
LRHQNVCWPVIIGEFVDACMDVYLDTHTTVETFQLTHSVVNKRKIQKYYILTEEKWDVICSHMATGP